MKVFFVFFLASTGALTLNSQTFDFESWTGSAPNIEPTGWVSSNVMTGFPFNNPQSVFQENNPANVYGGAFSMKIVSVTLTNNPTNVFPNPIGYAMLGTINLSPIGLKEGCKYTQRPATAEFWYKYAPSGNDSASCYIILSKWNTNRDIIAVGSWVLKTAATTYSQATINLIYIPAFNNILPDTMQILFTATCYDPFALTCGKDSSTLWIDDVTFSGWNGINEPINSYGVTVFPNPTSGKFTVIASSAKQSQIEIYNVFGERIYQLTNPLIYQSTAIDISSQPNGVYFLHLKTDKESRTQKLIISK